MKKILYIICALLIVSCNKAPHFQTSDDYIVLDEDNEKDSGIGVVLGFNTDGVISIDIENLNVFFFDISEKLIRHNYFTSMTELASTKLLMESGEYTIFAVFNAQEDFLGQITKSTDIPELYLSGLISTISGYYDDNTYPNMLTGMAQVSVNGSLSQAIMNITDEPVTSNLTLLTLNVEYPLEAMQIYTKATTQPLLRIVVEAYKSGTTTRIARKTQLATEDINLSLSEGSYDIRVWSDYTLDKSEDMFYDTSDTESIKISKDDYTACSDYRAAYAALSTVEVSGSDAQSLTVSLYRPQAAYKIIANDVDDFLRKTGSEGGEFTARVSYGFYLPLGYNLATGKPCSSEAGVSYTTTVTIEENEANEAIIACDYVFVNGTESFVSLVIEILDDEGNLLSGINGLQVPYKRDYLTIINADILTSELEGGIEVNPNWDDDIYVDLDQLF